MLTEVLLCLPLGEVMLQYHLRPRTLTSGPDCVEQSIWIQSKNSGRYVKLARGGVKVGFRAVSMPLADWDEPKKGPEWSRTFPDTLGSEFS